ncbi:hypothetical protein P154DRAFT_579021 [Amniculicola lignicola CBS 123094]|uniref:Uncharacterized protein n=1 Tax=Amniculicola lignicola CBS 123094 TaxID=1392246 RepID=A0A6A5W627_9PLEO|nr:hypothetical protein P154DRAFT_579021 [Amniculicola lignicola CBS 123094]
MDPVTEIMRNWKLDHPNEILLPELAPRVSRFNDNFLEVDRWDPRMLDGLLSLSRLTGEFNGVMHRLYDSVRRRRALVTIESPHFQNWVTLEDTEVVLEHYELQQFPNLADYGFENLQYSPIHDWMGEEQTRAGPSSEHHQGPKSQSDIASRIKVAPQNALSGSPVSKKRSHRSAFEENEDDAPYRARKAVRRDSHSSYASAHRARAPSPRATVSAAGSTLNSDKGSVFDNSTPRLASPVRSGHRRQQLSQPLSDLQPLSATGRSASSLQNEQEVLNPSLPPVNARYQPDKGEEACHDAIDPRNHSATDADSIRPEESASRIHIRAPEPVNIHAAPMAQHLDMLSFGGQHLIPEGATIDDQIDLVRIRRQMEEAEELSRLGVEGFSARKLKYALDFQLKSLEVQKRRRDNGEGGQ